MKIFTPIAYDPETGETSGWPPLGDGWGQYSGDPVAAMKTGCENTIRKLRALHDSGESDPDNLALSPEIAIGLKIECVQGKNLVVLADPAAENVSYGWRFGPHAGATWGDVAYTVVKESA